MLNVLGKFVQRHKTTGILVDTNMLLLYLVGKIDLDWVKDVNPKREYERDDFIALSLALDEFDKLLVTAAILAEVSNLAAVRLNSYQREVLFSLLKDLLLSTSYSEQSAALGSVCTRTSFVPLGFTDATIEELANSGVPVMTDDGTLYRLLAEAGKDVFNFNHLRPYL